MSTIRLHQAKVKAIACPLAMQLFQPASTGETQHLFKDSYG
ncbi:hypothetical protein [Nostoc sp. JL23]|nr:hypothetical protein [Nostoc sp. JL23]